MTDVIYRSKGALIEFISNNIVNLSASSNISASAFYGTSLSASSNISASAFYGDGSNLTGVTASAVQVADGPEYSLQFRLDSPISGEISGSSNLMYLGGSPDLLQLTGNFHIQVGDGNAAAAPGGSDDLIISSDDNAGITILTSDNNYSQIFFGSPTDNVAAGWNYSYNQGNSKIGTYVSGHEFKLVSGNGSVALTLDENQHVSASQDLVVSGQISGSGNISGSSFYGDGSNLSGIAAGISWDGSTANGVATFKDADEATVESNLTFDGSTLTVTGDASITGNTTLGDTSGDTVTVNGITTGVDDTVVIINGSGVLKTDEINSAVWDTTATFVDTDGTGTDNEIAIFTDSNSVEGDSNLTWDGATFDIGGALTVDGYVTLPSGLSSSIGTQISNDNNGDTTNKWVKVAEATSTNSNDRAAATIDVMLQGHETTADMYQARVYANARMVDATISICQVDIIQDEGAVAWDTDDFVLTQKTTSTYKAELWVRTPLEYQRCYATITNGSSDGRMNYKTDWYLTPGQTWAASSGSLGTYATTTNVKKRFDSLVIDGDLTVSGNDIKNSAALTTITMNADGSITSPLQPMVYAFRNSEQDLSPNTSWETVIFNDDSITNDTAFDVGGDYNTSTGVFTAPADGKYLISVEVMLTNVPASTGYILLYLVTTKSTADSFYQYSGRRNPVSWDAEMDYYQAAGTWLANMADGDTAYVQIRDTSADSDTKIYGSANTSYTRIQIMKVA